MRGGKIKIEMAEKVVLNVEKDERAKDRRKKGRGMHCFSGSHKVWFICISTLQCNGDLAVSSTLHPVSHPQMFLAELVKTEMSGFFPLRKNGFLSKRSIIIKNKVLFWSAFQNEKF